MKKKRMYIFSLVVLLLIGGCVFINWQNRIGNNPQIEFDQNSEDWDGNRNPGVDGNTISIPGYEKIVLKAGTRQQNVNFHNPEVNTAYFKISLWLPDGTKIWQSNLIEPSKGIYNITLNQTLSVGEYENAILKYECFAMNDDLTPLNGSDIKLTLQVIK